MQIFIGCAGWNVPRDYAEHFPTVGSHLERYAARFKAVEINSSFYRPHRPQTYRRWADAVPDDFRFAVKVPKSITHEHRLKDTRLLLDAFLGEVTALGDKLGPLLVQLPPSQRFDLPVALGFLTTLRERFDGQVVCEPRHPSWFVTQATELLTEWEVARVAADPAPVPAASAIAGWGGLAYYRLHGSPTIYYSAYSPQSLENLSARLQEHVVHSTTTWCVFDNTAEGAATGNALQLGAQLGSN